MATTRLLTGKIIGKCYLETLIGEGATAQVYRARHQTLGIPVAVKVLHAAYTDQLAGGSRAYQERFRREAQITARLSAKALLIEIGRAHV
jgi:eukaryotic-like serine/threonine-protein kinase